VIGPLVHANQKKFVCVFFFKVISLNKLNRCASHVHGMYTKDTA
jgi:hypothetical protein